MMKFGMLHNTATGRYHPILFRWAPLPGGAIVDGAERYKSKGHHTEGFTTLEAATTYIDEICAKDTSITKVTWKDEWDGEDMPIAIAFFP